MLKYQYIEHCEHGSKQLPFQIYDIDDALINTSNVVRLQRVSSNNKGIVLPLHCHSEVELLYIVNGDIVIQVDDVQLKASPGNVIAINSGELHMAFSPTDATNIHYYAIVFKLDLLNSFSGDIFQSKYISPLVNKHCWLTNNLSVNTRSNHRIAMIVENMIETYNNKDFAYELELKSQLYHIFHILYKDGLIHEKAINKNMNNSKEDLVKKSLLFIEKNYSAKINLSDIASELSVSKYYFCGFFKEYFGIGLVEYVNHYRITVAKQLLQEHKYSITEISSMTGFDNASYFTKIFKSLVGISPSQYHKLH
jgi:AraC family transcriptional regulator, activator of mtrCDE